MKQYSSPPFQTDYHGFFLFKLPQVYETFSGANALKIGERNPIRRAFDRLLLWRCPAIIKPYIKLKCIYGLSSQHCKVFCNFALLFSYDADRCNTAILSNSRFFYRCFKTQFLCPEDFTVVNQFNFRVRWLLKGLFNRQRISLAMLHNTNLM